jgi:hypothetical protein
MKKLLLITAIILGQTVAYAHGRVSQTVVGIGNGKWSFEDTSSSQQAATEEAKINAENSAKKLCGTSVERISDWEKSEIGSGGWARTITESALFRCLIGDDNHEAIETLAPVITTCKGIDNTYFARCCDYNEDGQKLYCWTE